MMPTLFLGKLREHAKDEVNGNTPPAAGGPALLLPCRTLWKLPELDDDDALPAPG